MLGLRNSTWALWLVLVAGAACDRGTRNESATAATPATTAALPSPQPAVMDAGATITGAKGTGTMDATLSWNLETAGDKLRVHYEIDNRRSTPIWVVDDLLMWRQTAFARAPEALVVRKGPEPDTVSLYRGMMYIPSREMRQYPSPGVREVAPGARISGEAETSLPLAAWHYYHPKKMEPLEGVPKKAILEVQILLDRGKPEDWKQIQLADGSSLSVPTLRLLNERGHVLRSDPKPL